MLKSHRQRFHSSLLSMGEFGIKMVKVDLLGDFLTSLLLDSQAYCFFNEISIILEEEKLEKLEIFR